VDLQAAGEENDMTGIKRRLAAALTAVFLGLGLTAAGLGAAPQAHAAAAADPVILGQCNQWQAGHFIVRYEGNGVYYVYECQAFFSLGGYFWIRYQVIITSCHGPAAARQVTMPRCSI
jgi:hypothetical protein